VQILNESGQFVGKLALESPAFSEPIDVAIDQTGTIYVLDSDLSFISKFESYLKEGGVDMKLATDKDFVMKYIIAEFSRQLISEKEYFVTILKNDPMLNAALK
jgi:hypothetical protein